MSKKRINKKTFNSVGSVLNDMLPQLRPSVSQTIASVWDIWEQCAGNDVAAHARPVAFKGDLLLVHVCNSMWLHQLRYLEKELVAKLNEVLGKDRIKILKFKIGPV